MEKLEEVFNQYELEQKRLFRGKKILMFESNDGVEYGVVQTKCRERRLRREYYAKQYLIQNQFCMVDQICKSKQGRFIAMDRYHTPYIIKRFFNGRELDLANIEEVRQGAYNLSRLHEASRGMQNYMKEQQASDFEHRLQEYHEAAKSLDEMEDDDIVLRKKQKMMEYYDVKEEGEKKELLFSCVEGEMDGAQWMKDLFVKRNRELKRVTQYVQKKGGMSTFSDSYKHCSQPFLLEGEKCLETLRNCMETLKKDEIVVKSGFCHGNYQHHNLLKEASGWATIGFDKFHFGPQIVDLYDYMRKVLEKNNYDYRLVAAMFDGYERYRLITKEDKVCLALLFSYPEKFWKISNHYFNGKKTWVPPKMVEKLGNVVKQNQEKKQFLVKFIEDYADCCQ